MFLLELPNELSASVHEDQYVDQQVQGFHTDSEDTGISGFAP